MPAPPNVSAGKIAPQALWALMQDPQAAACLRVLDATWVHPGVEPDGSTRYRQAHIPGAQFFDIDAIADPDTALPHMLPSAEQFGRQMGGMGIAPTHAVVVYDAHGAMTAPRAWWMFRTMGHANVAVLDGGLPAWRAQHLPVTTAIPVYEPTEYMARVQLQWVAYRNQVQTAVATGENAIVDMRPTGRFSGADPEPRPGLAKGHIPSSLSAPWPTWLAPEQQALPDTDYRRRIAALRINERQAVICTCGSGVTACVGAWALHIAGHTGPISVYDGSWAEWGKQSNL